jgi:hypothetical protein
MDFKKDKDFESKNKASAQLCKLRRPLSVEVELSMRRKW